MMEAITVTSEFLHFVALVLAMINVVGGFAVTNRMLNMIAGKKNRGLEMDEAYLDTNWLSYLCNFLHFWFKEVRSSLVLHLEVISRNARNGNCSYYNNLSHHFNLDGIVGLTLIVGGIPNRFH